MDERVVIEGTEDEAAGIASILAELIRGNLARRPELARLMDRLSGAVAVTAHSGDDTVGATLVFGGGQVRVRTGADPEVRVRVTGTFEAILGLSQVPMMGNLPRPFREGTRQFNRYLRQGDVKITGWFRGHRLLPGLLRLVSVA
jgi:ketosteroid isomerase-like protein